MLVDDDASYLAAARVLLERAGVEVVGTSASAAEAQAAARDLRPDVAVADVRLGAERGQDLASWLTDGLGVPVLVSSRDAAELVETRPALGFVGTAWLSRTAITELLRHRRPR